MKYIYPAVFYYDKNTNAYCAAIEDLALYVDGATVEEAHKNASDVLHAFAGVVLRNGDQMPPPTEFEEVTKQYPKNLVILVECLVN